MNYSDPYHSSNHRREPSLPTVFEVNDPYRIVRKNQKLSESVSDNSNFDVIHSRTASDSSGTTCTGTLQTSITIADTAKHDDPYAVANYKNKKKLFNDRANSYLPYSHHNRDPNQKAEPIYIEEGAPATTSLGIGSILNDNILFNPDSKNPQSKLRDSKPLDSDILSSAENSAFDLSEFNKRKNKMKTYCGLRVRTIAFFSFLFSAIIIVIWYFVWPRIPTLTLEDVDNVDTIQVITNTTKKSMSANWLLNMTADNSNNWVPTHFKSIQLTIIDSQTNQQFGNGQIDKLTLPAKSSSTITIPMSIYYATNSVNDTTFQDLYNVCGIQVSSNSPFDNQQDLLNVTFSVTFHIYGIVWSTTKRIPYNGLNCPTN